MTRQQYLDRRACREQFQQILVSACRGAGNFGSGSRKSRWYALRL